MLGHLSLCGSRRAAARLTAPAAGPRFALRCLSGVVNLSDDKAVDKFRMVNHKSVLYFTASWCGPCRMIKPVFEDLSKKYPGVAFGKIDVDENEASVDFEITAVPTFILYEGETAVQRFTGADPSKLEKMIQDLEQR